MFKDSTSTLPFMTYYNYYFNLKYDIILTCMYIKNSYNSSVSISNNDLLNILNHTKGLLNYGTFIFLSACFMGSIIIVV